MATDPIIKDHQLWIGFVQPEGLVVSPHALKNAQAVLSHNVGAQQEILRRHTAPDFDGNLRLKSFRAFTQEFWGWRESDLAAPPDDLFARLPEYGETLRPTWVVKGGKGQPEHLILVDELSWGTDFDKSGPESPSPENDARRWHASPQARFERLLRETGIPIGLLVSPERIRLVYAPKGESSGHVTFPVHQMTTAANWPMLAALHLLLHSDRLFIGTEGQRLPAILEASRRYQNEVSIRLAGQVLRALNELVRGFQDADRAAHGKILVEARRHDPNHIYGGLLTTLMRMVFVLYAEDRSLMGSDETWLQNYSVSGLYERLRADEGQYPDTMDSRYGAWAQILTLTRLLYDGGGHGSWRLPARHGGLFDPDAYPFLEGRAWESKRSTTALIEPPLVSDGTLFRILQDLLYLDGERISYRALDVEQIGSVYEAMMGFTVETAHGISVGLGSDHLVVDLEDLLTKKPVDRSKFLKEHADCEVTGKAIEQLKSATSVDELLAVFRRRISKLYLDKNSNAVTVPCDGIFLQPTEERRRSGSHYTPRSLTQPIVKTTLDPVLAQLGDNPKPEQILALKVCDPAMGSGAFLVEACRYLGEKLEKAWIAHGEMPPIPADQDPLLHARRMVAQRCLYGVDKNPFAVNLAKLSLWLVTFAEQHPFTFIDHALRCGDSLVGLTAHQIEAFHWQPKEEGALLRDLPSRLRHILAARAQILDAADETPYETLAQKLAVTEERMEDLRLAGDLTVAAFFATDQPKEQAIRRKELAEMFHRAQERITDLDLEDELRGVVRVLKAGKKGVTPFHWEIEFPEVFGRHHPGFDAMVGNPPFAGSVRLASISGPQYTNWLRVRHPNSGGKTDVVAFFFRRAFDLLRVGGCFGLIATQTICQGDTRLSGLLEIRRHSGVIFNARRRLPWPGSAAVTVSVVHVLKPASWARPQGALLEGRKVANITAFLLPLGPDENPTTISRPFGAFLGNKPFSKGFIFADSAAGYATISEMTFLLNMEPAARQVTKPYLIADDLLKSVPPGPSRWAIDLSPFTLDEAKSAYPEAIKYLEKTVRPGATWSNWWQFARRAQDFRSALAQSRIARYLVIPEVAEHFVALFQSTETVPSGRVIVFPVDSMQAFALLQSRPHEVWVRVFSSSLEDRLCYVPADCFDNFPFPDGWQTNAAVNSAGQAYYDFRAGLMERNAEGLTATYNRFHDPDERNPEIARLRELHSALDRAVLDSYSWTDLQPRSEFILDHEDERDDEISPSGRERKKPWRYRWVDEDRDEVLARLLELNRTRAEEEAQSAPVKHATSTAGKRGRKSNRAPIGPNLFEVQGSPKVK